MASYDLEDVEREYYEQLAGFSFREKAGPDPEDVERIEILSNTSEHYDSEDEEDQQAMAPYDGDAESNESDDPEKESVDYPSEDEGAEPPMPKQTSNGSICSSGGEEVEDEVMASVAESQMDNPAEDARDEDGEIFERDEVYRYDEDYYDSDEEIFINHEDQNGPIQLFYDIFEHNHLYGDVGGVEERFVLKTMRLYPKLSERSFPAPLDGDEYVEYALWSPFIHLLYSGAETSTLLEVCKMHPDVLAKKVWVPQTAEMFPLSMALWFRSADTQLIRLMAEECPDALIMPSAEPDGLEEYDEEYEEYFDRYAENVGLLPIHIALKQGAPLETIQVLLEAWPEAVFQREWKPFGSDCFSLALDKYGEGNVLEMITKTIYQVASKSDDKYEIRGRFLTEKSDAKQGFLLGLRKVKVSRDTLLDCFRDGWLQFIQMLETNHAIQTLDAPYVPWEDSGPNKLDGPSLALCLKRNTVLQEFTLDFQGYHSDPFEGSPDDHAVDHSTVLHGLVAGLAHNRTMKKLQIVNCNLKNESALCKLLHAPSALVELHICDATIKEKSVPAMCGMLSAPTNSRLKELFLLRNKMPPLCLSKLAKPIAKLSQLEHLEISRECPDTGRVEWGIVQGIAQAKPAQAKFDISRALVELLARNKLCILKIDIVPVNVISILEALKSNTCLRSFLCSWISYDHEKTALELLESHNTSLFYLEERYSPLPFSEHGRRKAKILLKSNLLGRGKLKPGMQLRAFVDILCDSAQEWLRDEDMLSEDMLYLHYSLLHHCPSIWSSCGGGRHVANARKRKRVATAQSQ